MKKLIARVVGVAKIVAEEVQAFRQDCRTSRNMRRVHKIMTDAGWTDTTRTNITRKDKP